MYDLSDKLLHKFHALAITTEQTAKQNLTKI